MQSIFIPVAGLHDIVVEDNIKRDSLPDGRITVYKVINPHVPDRYVEDIGKRLGFTGIHETKKTIHQ